MSKQLAISSAISVMMMALCVLYGPSLAHQAGNLPQDALRLPQITGLRTLIAF